MILFTWASKVILAFSDPVFLFPYSENIISLPVKHNGTKQNPAGPLPPKYKTEQLMIRTIESQTQCLMHIPELFYRYCNCHQRGKKLTAWWPDCNHDISCSNFSSTESMASTIPRIGLKRMGLTLLLVIIYIFVGIKIIVACLYM